MKFFEAIDQIKNWFQGIRLIGNIPKALFQGVRMAISFIGWIVISVLKLLGNPQVWTVVFAVFIIILITQPKRVLEWIKSHIRIAALLIAVISSIAAACMFYSAYNSESEVEGFTRFESFWLNLATRVTELSFNIEEDENSVVRRSEEEYRNGERLPTQTPVPLTAAPAETESDKVKAIVEKAIAETLDESFDEIDVIFVERNKIHISKWLQGIGFTEDSEAGEYNEVLEGKVSYPSKDTIIYSVSIDNNNINVKFDTSVSKKAFMPSFEGGMNLTVVGPFLDYSTFNSSLLYGTCKALGGVYSKNYDFNTSYTSLLNAAEEKYKRELLPHDMKIFLSNVKSKIDFRLEEKYTISYNGVSSKDDYTKGDLKSIFGIDIPEGDLKISKQFTTIISTSTSIFKEGDVVDNYNEPFELFKECSRNDYTKNFGKLPQTSNHKVVVSPRIVSDELIKLILKVVLPDSTADGEGHGF